MAPRDGTVRIGNVRPIDAGQAPPPVEENPPGFFGALGNVFGRAGQDISNFFTQYSGREGLKERDLWGSSAVDPLPFYTIPRQTPALPSGTIMGALEESRQAGMDTGGIPFASAGGQYVPSPAEVLAAMSGGGGGGGRAAPDYSAYRAALTDQAQQLNAQIQAMYNQLAAQAGENVSRVQDIYGGASAGIGDVYGSATENIAQAYESAQQQAADQMARLGIEAAAPQILPTQALSQAEAVAGLEAGRAGGLSAAERYGASGAQFGSEMAQVAQQQGTEMNAAILASLQNRLNESLLMEEQGRQAAASSGGGGGMSLRDQIAFDEFYRQRYLGELPIEEQRRALELATETERAAQEAQATLNYRAAQLAQDFAPQNASPEEMQQAYELALSMLGG